MAGNTFGLGLLVITAVTQTLALESAPYTEEAPVKLLSVKLLADRYPTAESQYRTSLINGYVSSVFFSNYSQVSNTPN